MPVWAIGFSVNESVTVPSEKQLLRSMSDNDKKNLPVFGKNLFQGNFKQIKQPWYNPDYCVNIGDIVSIRIWGAFEFTADLPVDSQGNIFVPKVGIIPVLGVRNSDLVAVVENNVKNIFNKKVFVYANIANYQPVTVFVTGNVNKPGLYQGIASDSVLQFIDKAQGISPDYGSYRNIEIIRANKVFKQLDLYSFLISGKIDLFQFQNGDVVSVKNILNRVTVTGDVKRPFMSEFPEEKIKFSQILALAIPNPNATNATITRLDKNNRKTLIACSIVKDRDILVCPGDAIEIFPDHSTEFSSVTITGEHDGLHKIVINRNLTLGALISKLTLNSRSDINSIQVFRKSVAQKQKKLLLSHLQELESLILTTSSVTKEETQMRSLESKSYLSFIDRARTVTPKGQIVINENAELNNIYLEDEDRIHIPSLTSIIFVQGEVAFPGAHTYSDDKTVADYIEYSGDFTDRANKKKILVLHQNGWAQKIDSYRKSKKIEIEKGDSILVLPKLEEKNLEITKGITQILYQIAVSTSVILSI